MQRQGLLLNLKRCLFSDTLEGRYPREFPSDDICLLHAWPGGVTVAEKTAVGHVS